MVRRRLVDEGAIFMNSTLVATVVKNKLEEIRFTVLKNNKIDIRTYFHFPQEPEPKPTKKGIWLSFKHVTPIVNALEKLKVNPQADFSFELEGSDKEQLRVYTNEYLRNKLVHFRTFYLKNNEFQPGRGIAFVASLAPNMIDALRQAEKLKQ